MEQSDFMLLGELHKFRIQICSIQIVLQATESILRLNSYGSGKELTAICVQAQSANIFASFFYVCNLTFGRLKRKPFSSGVVKGGEGLPPQLCSRPFRKSKYV